VICCAVCREPIEPSEYGWTLIARGEHIDDPRGDVHHRHAPEQADSFACPCLVCPCCGWINDDPEQTHPEDGLAGPCGRCRYFEWWAVSGPHRDGRHMHSETERDEWNAHDTAVMEGRA
jgi:hypothetical protein